LVRFDITEEFAHQLDRNDPLKGFRKRFVIPEDTIYFDGNSLGLISKEAELATQTVLDEWKKLGIRGWLEAQQPWFYFSEKLGEMVCPLVGAKPEEVVSTGTTTVNIHSLISTFYDPKGNRKKILADELNFASDIYALSSHLNLRGYNSSEDLILMASKDNRCLDEEAIIQSMNDEVALVFLPSVLYRSGQLLDMAYLTKEAHRRGILIGFDCSHSVGAIPHKFDKWEVDFAVWCSYKYLNGGPGSSAFIYINQKHFQRHPKMHGWFGYVKEKQFDMLLDFDHQKSAGGWQISSPSILGCAPLFGALRITREADIHKIREKSRKMTSYLISLIDQIISNEPYSFSVGSPREDKRRGGHVALERGADAWRICKALKAKGVIPDFRPPDIIRLAPVALYNTYHEIWRVVHFLKEIVDQKIYCEFDDEKEIIS
jgi:kynureninase